jgi:flavin-dependent dehydrogenase
MVGRYDALVIGGGPGGAAAALLLARAGRAVVVVEKKSFPRRKVCGEFLSATSLPLLDYLGVGEAFRRAAGPEVRRVGLFAGPAILTAELPAATSPLSRLCGKGDEGASALTPVPSPAEPGEGSKWGRALGRERLDSLLLAEAAAAGATVLQPFSAIELQRADAAYRCVAVGPGPTREIRANLVIAAHGSWEVGALSTQVQRRPPRGGDLFGFKAHFHDTSLSPDLMPLLAFPGGYGGMVTCDEGRVSLSCCVRRDRLARIREPGEEAGEAVLRHLRASCRGVDEALSGAMRVGPWLAAGPIRPGIRLQSTDRVFRVGNAAGEAHPVVAEGISMALQGAWLLAERLTAPRRRPLPVVAADYARAWRRAFRPRLLTSTAVAHWAMHPAAVAGAVPIIRRLPALLTWGARLSGKTVRVVR